jgi:GTPase SAR1 family protein
LNAEHSAYALHELLRHYDIALLVGLSKAAGKTTVLNALIEASFAKGYPEPLAVTSIGQGGSIPETRLYPGMFAATASGCLPDCDFTRKIYHMTGINTSLGEVAVVQALSCGRIRLAGPAINSRLDGLLRYLKEDCGAVQIIVDGAGDRKTFAGTGAGAAVVLCAGAGERAFYMEAAVQEIAHACRIMSIPAPPECDGNGAFTQIDGALTIEAAQRILEARINNGGIVNIAVSDPGKIFLDPASLDKLEERGLRIYARNPVLLAAIALNPEPFAPTEFIGRMREAVSVPVFDVVNNG